MLKVSKGDIFIFTCSYTWEHVFFVWTDLAEILHVTPWGQGAPGGPQTKFLGPLHFDGIFKKQCSSWPILTKFWQVIDMTKGSSHTKNEHPSLPFKGTTLP